MHEKYSKLEQETVHESSISKSQARKEFVWSICMNYRDSDKQDIKQVFDILFVITALKNKIQWHKLIEKILRMKYFVNTIILNELAQESLKG